MPLLEKATTFIENSIFCWEGIMKGKREAGNKAEGQRLKAEVEQNDSGRQKRVFVGAWVTEAFTVEVKRAADRRGFPGRAGFLRYVLEFAVNQAT
jgi:hypothetical protein